MQNKQSDWSNCTHCAPRLGEFEINFRFRATKLPFLKCWPCLVSLYLHTTSNPLWDMKLNHKFAFVSFMRNDLVLWNVRGTKVYDYTRLNTSLATNSVSSNVTFSGKPDWPPHMTMMIRFLEWSREWAFLWSDLNPEPDLESPNYESWMWPRHDKR